MGYAGRGGTRGLPSLRSSSAKRGGRIASEQPFPLARISAGICQLWAAQRCQPPREKLAAVAQSIRVDAVADAIGHVPFDRHAERGKPARCLEQRLPDGSFATAAPSPCFIIRMRLTLRAGRPQSARKKLLLAYHHLFYCYSTVSSPKFVDRRPKFHCSTRVTNLTSNHLVRRAIFAGISRALGRKSRFSVYLAPGGRGWSHSGQSSPRTLT